MHAIPGDPFQDEQGIPEEVIVQLKRRWGLDRPIYEQYFSYLDRIFHGDLGTSLRYPSQTVFDILKNGFPISALLGLQAMGIALPCGLCLGILWGKNLVKGMNSRGLTHPRKRYRHSAQYIDGGFSTLSTICISTPNFVIAALLQLIFSIWIPLFPVARWGTIAHMVLPTLSLAIGPIAMITRVSKAKTIDIMNQEWVTMARMKGLSEGRIIRSHVLPHVVIPVLSYLGPVLTNLLVGSFAIERVYGIPGLGQWFVNSILTRDYPVIAGLTLFYSCVLFSCHVAIDLIIRLIDGRKRRKTTFSQPIAHEEGV